MGDVEIAAKVQDLEAKNEQLRRELIAANQLADDWRRRAIAAGYDADWNLRTD